jgi:hypothetical protein
MPWPEAYLRRGQQARQQPAAQAEGWRCLVRCSSAKSRQSQAALTRFRGLEVQRGRTPDHSVQKNLMQIGVRLKASLM